MIAAARACVSLLMLAGFYVVGLLQLVVAVALAYGLTQVSAGILALKIVWAILAAVVGATLVATWRAIRHKPQVPSGLALSRQDSPELWDTVHDLARQVGTRVPDEIQLVPDVNAWVTERSRLLGLVGGRRVLSIGLPLMQVLAVDQLRAVLAHELGHYSHRHTRFAGMAYRGRVAIAETLSRIGPYNVAGWIFKKYGALYVLVDNAVSRRQEYEADRAAVRVAGPVAAATALRELPVLDAALDFYVDRYLRPGWETGYAPADLFGGFAEFVAEREDELAKLRGAEPPQETSRWDTHPPMAERIAAIESAPGQSVPRDERPATVLLRDPASLGPRLQDVMGQPVDATRLPWDEYTNAMLTAQSQRAADRVFRTIARLTKASPLHLGVVLDLAAAGRLQEIAQPFFPEATRRELPSRFVEVLEPLLRLAALRSGVARWRHSLRAPAEFTAVGGHPLPLQEIAKLAATPEGVTEARRRLAELGIDVTTAALVAEADDAIGAELITALANVKVERGSGRAEYDLLVLTKGFVFVSEPGRVNKGKRRLERILQSASPADLAEEHWFLPYEEVSATEVTRDMPVRATLTLHNGERISLKERVASESLSRETQEILVKVIRGIDEG